MNPRIPRRLLSLFMLSALFLLAACDVSIIVEDDGTIVIGGPSVEETAVPLNPGDTPGWYDIYFTDPDCPPEDQRTGGLDEFIAEDMLRAETQVDIAAFDLDAEPIVNALIELEQRGIPVRVVTDEDNGSLSSINRLRRNGVSVVEDKRSGLMHNKFIIIDGHLLYTGSMNFTTNGAYCNNNNLIRIDSSRLAQNYIVEMDEMYDERQFGPDSPENTPREQLTIEGISVENYFSPELKVAPIIAEAVSQAQEEILFMAFSFTEETIGEAMMARAEEGVTVRGVFETVGSSSEYSYYGPMRASSLPTLEVWQDGNPKVMHHKVIIIDRETVIFGSFNFSDSANRRNDENTLIIHDPTFASYFVEEFEAVLREAKPN
jgi:phosphatidylserine/phosphatidylglycerophosphate/cardiolipin synthase-like enzyme